jgi:hypothetical protein
MSEKNDGEPMAGFDQTNGLADGLDGDDGGTLDPDSNKNGLLNNVVNELTGEPDHDAHDPGETDYSEEGRI